MGPVHIRRRVLLIPSLLPGSLTEQQASIIIIINITILAIHQFETYLHRNKNIQYLFNLSTQISLQPMNPSSLVQGPQRQKFQATYCILCLCRNQNCCPEIVFDHPPLELRVLNNAIGHFACRQQWWEEDPLLRTFYFLYTNFKWWASAWMLFVQMFIRMAC